MKTTIDITKARHYLEQLNESRQKHLHERFLKAREAAQRIVRMLAERYPVTRIYQWGSLLEESHFSEISDIDIAIEGDVSAEDFFRLYGEAMEMTNFHLDLVQLDKIDPLHAKSIRKKGRIVYER